MIRALVENLRGCVSEHFLCKFWGVSISLNDSTFRFIIDEFPVDLTGSRRPVMMRALRLIHTYFVNIWCLEVEKKISFKTPTSKICTFRDSESEIRSYNPISGTDGEVYWNICWKSSEGLEDFSTLFVFYSVYNSEWYIIRWWAHVANRDRSFDTLLFSVYY